LKSPPEQATDEGLRANFPVGLGTASADGFLAIFPTPQTARGAFYTTDAPRANWDAPKTTAPPCAAVQPSKRLTRHGNVGGGTPKRRSFHPDEMPAARQKRFSRPDETAVGR
jgi:hypothetical protein